MSKPANQLLITSAYSVPLNGETPAQIMFFPAGKSTIRANVNGKPKQIAVNVTPDTAEVMQSSLTELLKEPVDPFIDFDHKSEAAAALPKTFEWKEGEGVMLNLDWTSAGKSAVEGKAYRYFSPTFMLNEAGAPSSLPDSGPVGALTNNPAFRRMKKISASQDDALTGEDQCCTEPKGTNTMAEEAVIDKVTAALKTELETLRNENRTLREQIETQRVEAIEREADMLIESAVQAHKIEPKNERLKTGLKKLYKVDAEGAREAIESLVVNPAFNSVVKVTAAHKDIGNPPRVSDTKQSDGNNSGKLCNAKVEAIRSQFPHLTYEAAWRKAQAEFPDIFEGVPNN